MASCKGVAARRWLKSPRSTASASRRFTWQQRFSGRNADKMMCLWQLGQKNSRLKKLLAERDLEIEIMKEIAAEIGVRTARDASRRPSRPARVVATQGVRAVLLTSLSARLRVVHDASVCSDLCFGDWIFLRSSILAIAIAG